MWLFKNRNSCSIYYIPIFLKCRDRSYFNPIFYLQLFFFRKPLDMTDLKNCFKNNYINNLTYCKRVNLIAYTNSYKAVFMGDA